MEFENKKIYEILPFLFLILFLFVLFLKFNIFKYKKKFLGASFTSFYNFLKREFHFVFIFFSIFFLLLGFFKFKVGEKYGGITESNVNFYFLFDISYSMLGEDVTPSRLDGAKALTLSILDHFPNESYAVIPFAGKGFILSPLTSDVDTVKFLISRLSPENISNQGSDVNGALKLLLSVMSEGEGNVNVPILLTDGEFFKKVDVSLLNKFKKNGVKFITVGIGSEEGSKIMDPRKGYRETIKVGGKDIISKLHPENLKLISEKTGGKYIDFKNVLYAREEIISFLKRDVFGNKFSFKKVKVNGSYILFFLSFLFFVLYFFTGKYRLKKALFTVLFFFIFLTFIFSNVSDIVKRGNSLYLKGNYSVSIREYVKALKDVERGINNFLKINLNISLSLFKMGDYEKAAFVLENGLNSFKGNKVLKGDALYNLGTIYLFAKKYQPAKTFLEKSLEIDPLNVYAKYNLELVLKRLSKNKKSKNREKRKNIEKNLNSLRDKEKTIFESQHKKKKFGLKGPYW